MERRIKGIIFVVLSTLFTSSGQLLWKGGADRMADSLFNLPLILGTIIYGLAALLLILALRYGEITLIYPFIASSYIWVSLASSWFFNESLSGLKMAGIALIIVGVVLVCTGGLRKSAEVAI